MKQKCKGETFPKETPCFYIQQENIIKEDGMERYGKMSVGNGTMFVVENPFTITRYKNEECALQHFNSNVKINCEIRKSAFCKIGEDD